jgi:hypothetical protein
MTNYYKKVKNEKILPTKRDPMRTQWRKYERLKVKAESILLRRDFFTPPDIKPIDFWG